MANETTDQNFEQDVLKSSKPVLVDFWAEWCMPCRQLTPIVEEIAKEKADTLDVYKVNIDHNPDTPTRYGVRGIPTLILFKDGKVAATKVGSLPKSVLLKWVEEQIGA